MLVRITKVPTEDIEQMPYGGGPLTAAGAKEILRDGTVHGKKLTAKQKKYFGYIAGGGKPKKQEGGQIPSVQGVSPKDHPVVEAEKGEVFQNTGGELNKVSEQGNTHEQGGELLNDVSRVLEDTSDKRNDPDSKALKISPEMIEILTGYKPTKALSHSKAMEKALKYHNDNLEKVQKSLRKNVETLKKSPNNPYAKNSMDLNIDSVNSSLSEGELFDRLFNHQELVKAMTGIGQDNKAQNGIQVSDLYIKRPRGISQDELKQWVYNPEFDKLYGKGWYKVKPTPPDIPGLYIKRPRGIPQEELKNWVYDPEYDRKYGKGWYKVTDQKEMPNVTIIPTTQKDIEQTAQRQDHNDAVFKILDASKNRHFSGNTDNTQSPHLHSSTSPTGTTSSTNTSFPQPNQGFNEPLNWYDVAGPISSYLSALNRVPSYYNPVQFNKIRLQLQNPLPALREGQSNFNAAIQGLPREGVGFSNFANVFSKKYAIDNQILGQYENINKSITNQQNQYNAQVSDRQSAADQEARQRFHEEYLGSLEAQRKQKLQSLDDLYQRLALNRKLNREGNLLMKLFPAFTQTGDPSGYKYQFRLPLNVPTTPYNIPVYPPKK